MNPKPTFESALKELEDIVKALESGSLSLEESLKHYQEGMRLAHFCHEQIKNAEEVIVKLMKGDELVDFPMQEE
ncbi:MAG: exodeoxyribonuclease VII small subunit [Candidatus Izemoplasmatales bacterium]|nr:exodeoxyribonuclease VII small subunit [Candidatus Izemoplasmatales bacterium]MDD5293719.1 exodeoxyribonuclease VII small subunit [Candidatus Izemoplasmatales bacterium]